MTTILEVLKDLQAYYEKEISPHQARVYLEVLGDVNPDTLQRAAIYWMRENTWFPRANQLLDMVARVPDKDQQRAYEDPSLDFWRAMVTYNAVLRGEVDPAALAQWPDRFDLRGNIYEGDEESPEAA